MKLLQRILVNSVLLYGGWCQAACMEKTNVDLSGIVFVNNAEKKADAVKKSKKAAEVVRRVGEEALSMFPLELQKLIKEYSFDPMDYMAAMYRRTVLQEQPDARGHGGMCAVAIGYDGTVVTGGSGYQNHTPHVWNNDGSLRCVLPQQAETVKIIALGFDGTIVTSFGYEGKISVWNSDGSWKFDLLGHVGEITAIAIAQDGKIVTGAGYCIGGINDGVFDNTARIWERDGSCRAVLRGHKNRVSAIAVDNEIIVTGSWNNFDGTARIWNWQGELKAIMAFKDIMPDGHGAVYCIALPKDGTIVLGNPDVLSIWDRNGKLQGVICYPDSGYCNSWIVAQDGSKVAGTGSTKTVRIIDGKKTQVDLFTARCFDSEGKLQAELYGHDVHSVNMMYEQSALQSHMTLKTMVTGAQQGNTAHVWRPDCRMVKELSGLTFVQLQKLQELIRGLNERMLKLLLSLYKEAERFDRSHIGLHKKAYAAFTLLPAELELLKQYPVEMQDNICQFFAGCAMKELVERSTKIQNSDEERGIL